MISLVVGVLLAQQGSYFARTFPVPTGNNGWEEYLMAADIMRSPDAIRAVDRYETSTRSWDDSIESARETVAKFGRACDLFRLGNKKPLTYPWSEDEHGLPDDPVGREYFQVVKLLLDEARVRFADGRPAAAAESILTGIVFARRYSGGSTIEALKGSACYSMILASLYRHLHSLQIDGLRILRLEFERQVAGTPPYVRTLFADFERDRVEASNIFDNLDEESEYFDIPNEMFQATPAQKSHYLAQISQEILNIQSRMRAMFQKEERFWLDPVLEHPDPVVRYAIDRTLYAGRPMLAVRDRTQLRLAAIHCRIIEFKRTHNRWPNALTELGGKEVWYDPASGGPFYYAKLTDQSYTLYSPGTQETGRIDLVWRPEPQLPNNRHVPRNARAGGLEWNRRY